MIPEKQRYVYQTPLEWPHPYYAVVLDRGLGDGYHLIQCVDTFTHRCYKVSAVDYYLGVLLEWESE